MASCRFLEPIWKPCTTPIICRGRNGSGMGSKRYLKDKFASQRTHCRDGSGKRPRCLPHAVTHSGVNTTLVRQGDRSPRVEGE
jgi:hypothetical protein